MKNAIERIGVRFEGVLRNKVIRYDGKRSSAYYSIIDEEWLEVKLNLGQLVINKNSWIPNVVLVLLHSSWQNAKSILLSQGKVNCDNFALQKLHVLTFDF